MMNKNDTEKFIQFMLMLGISIIILITIGTGAMFGFGQQVVLGLVGVVGLIVFGRLMMRFLQMIEDE